MKTSDKLELIEKLSIWLKETNSNPNRWSRDPLGSFLKSSLTQIGNWKNSPRGNPKKGGRASYIVHCKKNNPDYREYDSEE